MKITARRIFFPVSTWVHAIIQTCENQLAIWYKDHKGIPTVCCLYPRVDGPTFYEAMITWGYPGKFVWQVLPYRQPYTIVQPPTPPYGQCPEEQTLVPGKVLSGGPGATYQVQLYPNGPGGAAGDTVTCTQLQIDPNETIPAGTWAIVAKSNNAYYMQVPVWM